jgi:uncharacterized OsmC-like protein
MDREHLRAIQKPIKQRYKDDPDAALITLRAEGQLDEQEIACSVTTARGLIEAGLHPGTGGSGSLACSGDILLQALVACAGVTLRSVATSLGIEVAGVVRAEGDLDFRGTLGVAGESEVPVGFRAIRLGFELTSDASDEQLSALMRLTERYCVVYQTLHAGVPLAVSSSVNAPGSAEVSAR